MSSSPPSKRCRVSGVGSYCGSEQELTEEETIRFTIRNFGSLSNELDEFVKTSKVKDSVGNSWYAKVYPRGSLYSYGETEYVSISIKCSDVQSNANNKVTCRYTIRNQIVQNLPKKVMEFTGGVNDRGWCWKYFAKRADILSNGLDDHGTLVLDFDLQVYVDATWYPKEQTPNPLGIRLLESSKEWDATFVVGEEQRKFRAHKIILCVQAPALYELVHYTSEVPIPNVSGCIFEILLEHVYTGILPEVEKDDVDHAKSLLLGADMFQFTSLKLQMESELVSKVLDTSNAADLLLFADGHSCPLLKEACFEKCNNNMSEVMNSTDWTKVMESSDLISELLLFKSGNNKRVSTDSNYYDIMPVGKLREELDSRQLDLDGTKPMLIQRLKDHDGSDNNSESMDDFMDDFMDD